MKFKFRFLFVVISISSIIFFGACDNVDYSASNTFINEETQAIDNEYIFKVLDLTESRTYSINDMEYDSRYDNGLFLSIKISVHRKTIEKANSKEINAEWFKLKRGKGFTVWKTSIGETIDANTHIDALESSVTPFELEQNETKEIIVVFEIAENYLDTDRILTLEIDRPWTVAGAKEIVLIHRPDNL